ncbi:MAG: Lrp/AsnC ligand binding domain-containing protein [Nitrospirales bacterium]
MPTKAYILMKVKAGKVHDVLNTLKTLPGVEQAHACFGHPDIFGLVNASDDRALSNLIMTKIHTIPGVEETDTHIVVQE